ncbi:MAG: amidohydrolase family protein [Proteobacteria bacterium]|nr:amidohydrolase family protein [Pseudomonadota bacterium]
MNRRGFLAGGAIAAGASALAAWRLWPEQGLWNPCLARLPRRLAEHELVKAAWEGLDPALVWDAHAHLVGTGDSASGIRINPRMDSLLNPGEYARRLFFLNAGCAHDAPGNVDQSYIERIENLVAGLARGVKLLLFAFDRAFDEKGEVVWEDTGFYVPDAYVRDTAARHKEIFEWVASIHPYRRDCIEALEDAKRRGARAVKWLPAAMGIDPASPLCDRFYSAAARLGLPLISHAGLERAVPGRDAQDYGNPLRLRRALDAGVRVVVAHCASMGQDRDLDRGEGGPVVDSFELFARMMGEPRYAGRLFGDISAMTQTNRAGTGLARVIRAEEWQPRLLNGSDYPLPGLMPIFSVDYLVSLGLIEPAAGPVLTEIRRHNPLLFDFVTKRSLRAGGRRLANSVFETRGFFDPLASAARTAGRRS